MELRVLPGDDAGAGAEPAPPALSGVCNDGVARVAARLREEPDVDWLDGVLTEPPPRRTPDPEFGVFLRMGKNSARDVGGSRAGAVACEEGV